MPTIMEEYGRWCHACNRLSLLCKRCEPTFSLHIIISQLAPPSLYCHSLSKLTNPNQIGRSGEAQKIIHSSPSIKPFQQLTTPTIPEKVPNPPRTKMLMRKPGLDQAAEGKEELEQPAKKKVKTNRPSVPPPSGSRGSQPQKWAISPDQVNFSFCVSFSVFYFHALLCFMLSSPT